VVPTPGASPVESDLRAHLKERLPPRVVPSTYVTLSVLPRTPNGKVDRKRLPPPGREMRTQAPEPVPGPRGRLEREVVGVWERLLKRGPIGRDDDFFEVGGHSLLAVALVAELQKRFAVRLPLDILLQAPTPARLADELVAQLGGDGEGLLVALQPAGSRPPLFLIHPEAGHVMVYQDLARKLGTDQPVLGIRAVGLLGTEPPLTTVGGMAARYLQEIRASRPRGPYHLGGAGLGALIAFEMACQLRDDGEAVGLVTLLDCDTPGAHRNGRASGGRVSRALTRAWKYVVGIMSSGMPSSGRLENRAAWQDAALAAAQEYRLRPTSVDLAIFAPNESTADPLRQAWAEWTTGTVRGYPAPGTLASLDEAQAESLAASLNECLRSTPLAGGHDDVPR
jgi:surfactin synthase thioesterase subunit/acyl carrier protein